MKTKPKMRQWALAATGRDGKIAIDLDQPTSDQGPWQIQLRGPSWELVFDVSGPSATRDLASFVSANWNRNVFATFDLWKQNEAIVTVVKDPEFADRFWIRVSAAGQRIEVTISGEDAISLQKVLRELASQLEE